MSAAVHILVQFLDGKPHLTLGRTPGVRAHTREGSAWAYAKKLEEQHEWQNERRERQGRDLLPALDIRVLSIAIPDSMPVGEAVWPNICPETTVRWSW